MENNISKKILFVHHNSAPGGAELSFFDLVTNFSEHITPICAVPKGWLPKKLKAAGIKTFIVPMLPLSKSINPLEQLAAGSAWLKVQSQLKEICQQEKIDIIHANSLTAAIYSSRTADKLKIPLLWHERDLAVHSILTPQVAKFATKIIAISQAVADNLTRQLGSNEKIALIYNGIDVDRFKNPGSAGIPSLPDKKRKVLMAAQFVEWKGHRDFIEAAALVKKEISDTVLVLAGDKSKTEQYEYIEELKSAIADKGLTENFIWTGFVNNMPGLLDQIDCVVIPSKGEPFGRIAVEGMAAGKPVVAYASGALPEIITAGKDGCLPEEAKPALLASEIIKVLKDKEFAQSIGNNGKLRISQNFTIKKTIAEFEKLVKKL